MSFSFVKFKIRLLLSNLLLLLALPTNGQDFAPTVGVLLNEVSAYPSYTLFSNNEETYLIDNCGLIVNQWTSEYRTGKAVYLLANGQLLRTAELDGAFPISGRGGRFELFNWDGALEWYYEINTDRLQAHHDIAPMPNGNFLCLVWEKLSASEAQALGRTGGGELWSEAVYEIEILTGNEARIVWEWHLDDHLVQAVDPQLPNYGLINDFPTKVDINYTESGSSPERNWVHLNAIDYDQKLDQIVLSSRRFSEVWIIDHSITSTAAAGSAGDLLYRFGNPAAYGSGGIATLHHQHDARWVRQSAEARPQLMVFNNEEAFEQSSVKLWTPAIDVTGQYPLTNWEDDAFDFIFSETGFYSSFMSGAQWLPNGHIFVSAGMSGHFFELDDNKKIVWEYINPVNPSGGPVAQGADVRLNQTFRATKYGVDDPAFIGRDLSPGEPVEINPWESDCFLPEVYVAEPALVIDIKPTIVQSNCSITSNQSVDVELSCYDLQGRLLLNKALLPGEQSFDFTAYPPGMFVLLFTSQKGEQLVRRILVL
jgi:hypothetical protein